MDTILHLPGHVGPHRIADGEPIAGDASGRRYWRVVMARGGPAVLCRYPDRWRSVIKRDLEVLSWLHHRDLPVPRILAADPHSVWVLLEDLGRIDGETALRETPPASRVDRAGSLVKPLGQLSTLPAEQLPSWNPGLDRALLRWELSGFELWTLGGTRRREMSGVIQPWLDQLALEVAEHPQTICLRDFHLNNILVADDGRVGIIDVQDVRLGPDTYDLASLLGDRAMPELLTNDQRQAVAESWADCVGPKPGWERRLEATILQRSLKVLGTFAFLSAKGMVDYRRWVPTTALAAAKMAEKFGAPSELPTFLLDLATTGGFDVW